MPLSKLTIRDAEHLVDTASGQDVFHVYDPHALVQAAGYLKFKRGTKDEEGIFFRGETKLHETLSPTLFRGLEKQAAQSQRISQLTKALAGFRKNNEIFTTFSEEFHEAILQHYGLRTSWLDLVDNIWIALWFACHKAQGSGPSGEYLHFEKRSVHKEPGGFVYILLVAADKGHNTHQSPGHHIGKNTELIDLRSAVPSIFLRPHAQHGLVFRVRGDQVMRPINYASQIRGVIRTSLADALDWLGEGRMLGIHSLFPPPYYDQGYSILLNAGFTPSKRLGAIAHVGA